MHDTGCLELVQWDDPEGWYGEGGGKKKLERKRVKGKKRRKEKGSEKGRGREK